MLGNFTKIPDITVGDTRIYTKGTNINLRSEPNTSSKIIATIPASGTEIGKYAKFYYVDSSFFKWYEFFDGKYGRGWIRSDLATFTVTETVVPSAQNADAEAQQLINETVAQDKEIMNNLNTAAAMIEQLKAKGVSTSTSEAKMRTIFGRLQKRQEEMQKPTTWGRITGTISNAWGTAKKFFGFRGIGELITLLIVGGILIAVGAGASALVLIKPWKNQSNIDLKESKELKELLENADPATAQKIRDDLKGQLVDAYETGHRQGSVSKFMNITKYAAIGLLGIWILPKALDYFIGVRKKTRQI